MEEDLKVQTLPQTNQAFFNKGLKARAEHGLKFLLDILSIDIEQQIRTNCLFKSCHSEG